MTFEDICVLITFILYFALMLAIGAFFIKKNNNLSDYFLGGRQLGSWVTAMSAQASDMSGWLLMGLPAAAYMSGISASWIAIGLFIGTYLNWKVLARRLRQFTAVSGDSITIPQYLKNRFMSKSNAISAICAVIIFIFFLVYTASGFSAGAKLFQYVFHIDYIWALTIGAFIIIAYTFMGGFLAVCWTDLVQGILMFFTIIIIPLITVLNTPDFSFDFLSGLRGGTFMNLFGDQGGALGFASIISSLAWGLGYFGMPHILTRFMAIKSHKLIKKSRIIACTWAVISLAAAVMVGIFGYAYLTSHGMDPYASSSAAEVIFMDLVMKLSPALLAGVLLSAILAAVMSTADSQLLVTASAVANDFYKALFRKNASDKELMWVSRAAVLAIAVIAYVIAFDPNSSVMDLVSYAWAGFGAAFGPVILFSVFWKRMTQRGAILGMVFGGATVLIWETLTQLMTPNAEGVAILTNISAISSIYSLIPGFAMGILGVVVGSLTDRKPSEEVEQLFEKAKAYDV